MKSIIIYSTKYGSVEKAAQILKSYLPENSVLVNVMREKVINLEEFDTVVLGGSIYMGKIQKKLTNYINSNIGKLLEKRVGLFVCAGEEDPEKQNKQLERVFSKELFNHAVTKETFGYEINFEKANFFHKLIFRSMSGIKESYSKINNDKIEKFAQIICSE